MSNPQFSPEASRSFVQVSRYRFVGINNAIKSPTEAIKEAVVHGLSVVTIGVNVRDVTGKNEDEILKEVPSTVYRPREGSSFGIAVKVYELSPTGRVTLRIIMPRGITSLLNHQPEGDFESSYVQTGYEGVFVPERAGSTLGTLGYTEVRSPILAGMEAENELRLGFRMYP